MRVHIITLGSRGDVQPYVALAVALKKRGHTITVCTHSNFASFVTEHDLKFAEVAGDALAAICRPESKEWMETGLNPFKFVSGFRKIMEKELVESARKAVVACADADAVIGSGTGFYTGQAVAQVKQIPFVQAYVQPVHPTWEFPSALFPTAIKGGATVNFITHWLGGQLFWQALHPIVNRVRRDVFQIGPISPWLGPIVEMDFARVACLYGFSPRVLAKPKNWKPWHHVTGYWFLDEPEWQPPPAMQQFIDAGDPPICVGFGSISDTRPDFLSDTVLTAIKQSGERAILLTGWGGLRLNASKSDFPAMSEDVYVTEQAPHSWLFPRCKAIIHHGGSGTSGAAFRSGTPSVVVPFFGDQPFWAELAKKLGVGLLIQRQDLTAQALAAAIDRVCNDDTIRDAASALGRGIRTENGAAVAASTFDEYIAMWSANTSSDTRR